MAEAFANNSFICYNVGMKILKITGMNEIPFCIFWGNDIHHLVHIEHDAISFCSTVVIVVAAEEVLDL